MWTDLAHYGSCTGRPGLLASAPLQLCIVSHHRPYGVRLVGFLGGKLGLATNVPICRRQPLRAWQRCTLACHWETQQLVGALVAAFFVFSVDQVSLLHVHESAWCTGTL